MIYCIVLVADVLFLFVGSTYLFPKKNQMGNNCNIDKPKMDKKIPDEKEKKEKAAVGIPEDKKESVKQGLSSKFKDLPPDVLQQMLIKHVREVFKKYDNYAKGFLDEEEFEKLLSENTGNNFSPKEVKDLLVLIDKNKNKLVEEEELLELYEMLMFK